MNLTQEQRSNVIVTFSVNQYFAQTHDGILIGKYFGKDQMMADFSNHGIKSKLTGSAVRMYRSGY
jgi:hypothetical protein